MNRIQLADSQMSKAVKATVTIIHPFAYYIVVAKLTEKIQEKNGKN